MLKIDDLHVRYGTTHAVRGISFELAPGMALALLGTNGAGKTSTLNAISGLIPATGSITFEGEQISGLRAERIARRGIIHVPEGRRVFPDLTVHENLQIGMTARRGRTGGLTIDEVYDLFPALVPLRDRQGYALSGGEQQMLALGRGLVGAPRILMVDEPSLGLAPVVVKAVADALRSVAGRVSLLMVEQNAELALDVCDRAFVIKHGQIVLDMDAEDAHERETLLASYLGYTPTEPVEPVKIRASLAAIRIPVYGPGYVRPHGPGYVQPGVGGWSSRPGRTTSG